MLTTTAFSGVPTLARYVHGLLADDRGPRRINLAAPDPGTGAGFQYAAQLPDEAEPGTAPTMPKRWS